jgi:hypothetical protein
VPPELCVRGSDEAPLQEETAAQVHIWSACVPSNAIMIAAGAVASSRRDSVLQPRVANNELPRALGFSLLSMQGFHALTNSINSLAFLGARTFQSLLK